MKLCSGLIDRLAALVHPTAQRDPSRRASHVLFIALRLSLVLLTFICIPPYFAILGRPGALDAAAFAWMLAPLLAVWVITRTGECALAHTVSAAGFIGLATTLGLGAGPLSAAAGMWFLVAALDVLLTFSLRAMIGAALAAAVAIMALLAMKAAGVVGAVGPLADVTAVIFAFLALAYACASIAGAMQIAAMRHRGMDDASARYETLSQMIDEQVIGLDRSGNVHYAGESGDQKIGHSRRQLHGRGLFERIHVADRPTFLKLAADAADGHAVAAVHVRIRVVNEEDHREGAFVAPVFHWFEIRARRIDLGESEGAPRSRVQALAALRDIETIRQHEQELDTARREAERANRWKDRFLANVSHELRTPLNAIIGFSEILGNREMTPADPARQIEYARIIHESGHHLLSVVNSILDISKIEAGSFDINPEPFEVRPIVDQCCDMLSLKAQTTGIELVRNYPADLEEIVADKRAFKQIMINLLSNAVKFTPTNGVVTVNVRVEANSMLFEVADTGIGIPTPDLSRLGDPFFQARATYDRPYEGTGLGLSVVRGLVGLHGGAIALASAPGVGTHVTVRLPMDCRVIAKDVRTSAKIEAIPLKQMTGGVHPSNPSLTVKKIA